MGMQRKERDGGWLSNVQTVKFLMNKLSDPNLVDIGKPSKTFLLLGGFDTTFYWNWNHCFLGSDYILPHHRVLGTASREKSHSYASCLCIKTKGLRNRIRKNSLLRAAWRRKPMVGWCRCENAKALQEGYARARPFHDIKTVTILSWSFWNWAFPFPSTWNIDGNVECALTLSLNILESKPWQLMHRR